MRARSRGGVLAVAVAVLLAAGCSREAPTLAEPVADAMTAGVVDVAEAASAGDLETALGSLDALQQQLDTATADEDVTADRGARIQVSLDVVRADLESLLAAAAAAAATPEVPVETPVETPVPVEPVVPPEVQPQPADTSTDGAGTPGEKGNGKGADKSKAKDDKGKGKSDD